MSGSERSKSRKSVAPVFFPDSAGPGASLRRRRLAPRLYRFGRKPDLHLHVIFPGTLFAPAAVEIDQDLLALKFEPGDLHVIAGVQRGARRLDGLAQRVLINRRPRPKVEALSAARKRLQHALKYDVYRPQNHHAGLFLQRHIRFGGYLLRGRSCSGIRCRGWRTLIFCLVLPRCLRTRNPTDVWAENQSSGHG